MDNQESEAFVNAVRLFVEAFTHAAQYFEAQREILEKLARTNSEYMQNMANIFVEALNKSGSQSTEPEPEPDREPYLDLDRDRGTILDNIMNLVYVEPKHESREPD